MSHAADSLFEFAMLSIITGAVLASQDDEAHVNVYPVE